MTSLLSVLSLNVNASYGALENSYLGSVCACFDKNGFFLDADYLADNTADGCDFVTNLKIVSHICGFFFLLLLLSVQILHRKDLHQLLNNRIAQYIHLTINTHLFFLKLHQTFSTITKYQSKHSSYAHTNCPNLRVLRNQCRYVHLLATYR